MDAEALPMDVDDPTLWLLGLLSFVCLSVLVAVFWFGV